MTVLAGCELPSIQQESRRPCQPWQPIHLTRARNQSISAALRQGGMYCIGNPGESATDLEPRAIRPTYRAFALVFATSVSIRKDRESTPSQASSLRTGNSPYIEKRHHGRQDYLRSESLSAWQEVQCTFFNATLEDFKSGKAPASSYSLFSDKRRFTSTTPWTRSPKIRKT